MLPYNARSAASSGGGILRKTNSVANLPNTASQQGERQVDLLVFGYACKVFRDDPKAWEIDKGKHLIPWMGDGNLKIDRYDVRGALSELTPYEPPPGGYGNRLDYLSAEEQRAEQLCEEERYFYLYNNEEEHILQQEEDLKRLTQEASGSSYGRVDFQYDAATNGSGEPHGPNLVENQQRNDSPSCDEQPYTMPRSLQVPIPIQLPETMKQHAIIEKTARFIASQGVQMEILLKAKQSNNTQFEFLAQDGYLNPYYKFVLNAIKIGTYPTEESLAKEEEANQNEIKANESATISTKPIITVPTIKYQPSANCAYTQLISKIKGVPLPLPEVLNEVSNLAATTTTSSQPGGTSNAENSIDSPTTPILLQYGENIYVQATEEEEEHNLNSNSNSNSNFNTQTQEPQVEILSNSSALALAQNYSSGTESEDEMEAPEPEPMLRFPIPTENLKNIIDKTATYVIKNGRQFEETLRTKSEERFTFLVPENEYYPYYMYKITGDPNAASKEQKTRKAAAVAAALLSKKGLAGPVSFSIKAKEDTTAANLPAVLPQEPSDDDEDQTKAMDGAVQQQQQQQRNVPEHVQKAIKLVESQLLARNAQFAAAVGNVANVAATLPTPTQSSTAVRGRFDQLDYNSSTSASKIQMKSTRSEQERNAIYEQQQQNRQKELKKAEEKVKDKLAQIAREKLGGLINKDKQLQLERKRKAMAFINQIKGTKTEDDNTNLTNENEVANKKDTDGYKSDSSETSVHSIPITSYGPEDDDDDDEQNNMNESAFSKQFKREAASTRTTTATATTNAIRSEKILKAPTTTTKTTTVLLSDDDDIELISESRATSSTALKRLQTYDARERKRRKYSTESDVSQDSTGSSSSSDCSNYTENRRNKSRSHDKRSSARKSKKSSKKSSKSKKKRKHKSEHKYERRSNTTNTLSKQEEEEEKRRRRHDRRSRTHDSDTYSSSEESQESSVNQRRKLAVYDLFDRDNITPPASPRSSSSSSRRYKDTNERRHRRYER